MTRDDARATLLRALEQIDNEEEEHGDWVFLTVAWSTGRDLGDEWAAATGWATTAGPTWLHAALLRRVADQLTAAGEADDD